MGKGLGVLDKKRENSVAQGGETMALLRGAVPSTAAGT
jgi:hypothetical protein